MRIAVMLLLLSSFTTQAASRLVLETAELDQQYGYAFDTRITATGFKHSLSNIDLTPLRQDFGVEVIEYSSDNSNTDSVERQTLKLKLYPRRIGDLQIPSLVFRDHHSTLQQVHVTTATSIQGEILLQHRVSQSRPWQRQQVVVDYRITTPDRFASLQIDQTQIPYIENTDIPASQTHSDKGIIIEGGWAISALQAGPQIVELPPVQYWLGGVVERVFYLPLIKLDVRSLPSYVPPLMPVGKVSIRSSITPDGMLLTGDSANWEIILEGNSLTPHALPAVLRQLGSTASISIGSAESSRSSQPDLIGSHGTVKHQIPVIAIASGYLELPALHVQYFDPQTGRLVSITHNPAQPFAIAMYWAVLLIVLSLSLLVLVTAWGWRHYQSIRQYIDHCKQAMAAVGAADNPVGLRATLKDYALARRWPTNTSLGQWLNHWQLQHPLLSARDVIEDLARACYQTDNHIDYPSLHADIIMLLQTSLQTCGRWRNRWLFGQFQ